METSAIFMVGEQRSGSNLLRIALGQSDQIAAPHPPHILRRMMPLLPIYGDLDVDQGFSELVDDVCRLVERNPVQWAAVPALDRRDVERRCRSRSLFAVFGAVMDIYAACQNKTRWLCKSLSCIRYASRLNAHFEDAKYIYLYRDGRDVALSFSKAVVGDKHPYVIARKWAELQRLCLAECARSPERVHAVRYESLTAEPEAVIREICGFLDVPFQASMLDAHTSQEARLAAQSSSLWRNLSKPIMRNNCQKFLTELTAEQGRIIESVAGDCLDALGYERAYVPRGEETRFSEDEILLFEQLNRRMVERRLEQVRPDDRRRREHQRQVLDEVRMRTAA